MADNCAVTVKEYKTVLKDVLKFEIQALLDRLSEAGEESVVLTVSVDRLSCGHLGSRKGKGFVEASPLDEVQQKFLGFCSDGPVLINTKQTDDKTCSSEPGVQADSQAVNKFGGRVRKRKRTNPVKNNYTGHVEQQAMFLEDYEKLEAEDLSSMSVSEPTDLSKVSRLDNNDDSDMPCDLSTKDRNLSSQFVKTGDCEPSKDKAALAEEVAQVIPPILDHMTKEAESESSSSDGGLSQCWSVTTPHERKGDEITYKEEDFPNETHSMTPVTPVKQEGAESSLNSSTELNNISPTFRNALCLMPNPKKISSGMENGIVENADEPISLCKDSAKYEMIEPSMLQVKVEDDSSFQYSRPIIPPPFHPSDSYINFQRPICSLNSLQFRGLVGNPNPFLSHLAANQFDLDNLTRFAGSDKLKPKRKRQRKDSKIKIKTSFTKIFPPQLNSSTPRREPMFSYKDAGTICSECGQEFNKPESMIRHKIRKHLPRSFVCEVCQKGFSFKSELDKHFRIHSGEKPYTCNFCPKQFADGGNRMKHEIRCQKKLNQTF